MKIKTVVITLPESYSMRVGELINGVKVEYIEEIRGYNGPCYIARNAEGDRLAQIHDNQFVYVDYYNPELKSK